MKVGDLVIMKHPDSWNAEDICSIKLYMQEHPGSGVILNILDGGSHRKNISCEVYWTDAGKISWHLESYLKVM